ncbi:class F sortase [Promicromonospora sukumoe]|uniref:class F sortase n=1 Tax=Promicromonospora sukumoe TaxID=88382 RepID=UPI0036461C60
MISGTAAARAARRAARAAASALVLVLAACAAPAPVDPALPSAAAPEPSASAPESGVAVPVRPAQDVLDPAGPAATRLRVPALGIDVRVVPTGVDGSGQMELPASSDVAGWYRYGPAPGSDSGATVVAAHVDDEEKVGPFARLPGIDEGSAVRVRTADGASHNYTVTTVQEEPKTEVALDAVFDRSGPSRLVLVTCGGAWDAAADSYTDNIVVTATPVAGP